VRRIVFNGLAAAAMIGLGWTVGHAQRSAPDFELVVDAPVGNVKVECRRGCELVFGRAVGHQPATVNPQSRPLTTFSYKCSGSERCSSGIIAGWVRR
jgi:hypothetical protein